MSYEVSACYFKNKRRTFADNVGKATAYDSTIEHGIKGMLITIDLSQSTSLPFAFLPALVGSGRFPAKKPCSNRVKSPWAASQNAWDRLPISNIFSPL
jgi:hypothetical protein